MTITALKQISSERFHIVLEDGSEIKSTLGVITDLRLFSGKDLDDAALEELKQHSLRALLLEKAIDFLSRRQMSEKELQKKLLEKGADEASVLYCTARLRELRLLDDERYAAAVARHYSQKGYGIGRVRAELSHRGIARDLWNDAIEAMAENTDRIDTILRSRLKAPSDREQVRKVSASLYRRGFTWDQIRAALNRFSEDDHNTTWSESPYDE